MSSVKCFHKNDKKILTVYLLKCIVYEVFNFILNLRKQTLIQSGGGT